jgi:hypothetical protein
VGFHSTTSAVSFSFFSASPDERLASMGRLRRLASSWMCGSSKSEIWVLERELKKACNCSSTNSGVPDVGAIGRFGSWTPAGSFGVNFGVVGWALLRGVPG